MAAPTMRVFSSRPRYGPLMTSNLQESARDAHRFAVDVAAENRGDGPEEGLTAFLGRYLPLFYRDEQRRHAATVIKGKLSGLERKTTQPIASDAGHTERPVQHFVGAGRWEDNAIRDEMRRHVAEELGDPQAVIIVQSHAFPKKGSDSCGVGRQQCGNLGKVENCQVGYFLGYASQRGRALIDTRLYLPEKQANDPLHREQTSVPKSLGFKEGWQLVLDLVGGSSRELPHRWIVGGSEFGPINALRESLRVSGEHYVLEVPGNTEVLDPWKRSGPLDDQGRLAYRRRYERADTWAARQQRGAWENLVFEDAATGPREARAAQQWVQVRGEGKRSSVERLVAIRTGGEKSRATFVVTNSHKKVRLEQIVRAHFARKEIETLFEEGNREVGLSQYEVRSWVGWMHHQTLSLLALWFLQIKAVLSSRETNRTCQRRDPPCECLPAAELERWRGGWATEAARREFPPEGLWQGKSIEER